MWQEYHNSKVAQMVNNNGPKCIWSSGTLVDQLETFWTISDKTWILALKTQSAFWLSQWITVRFARSSRWSFATIRAAPPLLFWLSLGPSSLQITNNDQNNAPMLMMMMMMMMMMWWDEMQTYNKSIKSDNLQLIYKIIHTTYKKSIKTYNPLQPLTRNL